MNKDILVVANYLPQFHVIPENSLFWGEGYTDWVAVRNAVPLFTGHNQPRIPLGDRYYSLDKYDDIKRQVDTANKYGVSGFNIYHYWFSSEKNLLSKPADIILTNPELKIKYMFTWDNASWKRTWSAVKHANDWAPISDNNSDASHKNGVLIELEYGTEEDWKIHFEYLLKFFNDNRYIKEENKPVFGIFNPDNMPDTLKSMISYWDKLARQNGFNGIKVICKNNHNENVITPYSFTYEPGNSAWESRNILDKIKKRIGKLNTLKEKPQIFSYEKIWENLLLRAEKNKDNGVYYGCFVDFDDTPRRGKRGRIVKGGSPDLFAKYFARFINICKEKQKPMLFITAWNEWSEGAFLEPDEEYGYGYLEALKQVIEKEIFG